MNRLRARIALGSSTLVLVVAGLAAYNTDLARQSAQVVESSEERVGLLRDTRATLLDIESAHRGYLMTEDAYHLGVYHDALARLDAVRKVLKELRVGEGSPVRVELSRAVDVRLLEIDSTLKAFEASGRQEAVLSVRKYSDNRSMDRIRSLINDLLLEEKQNRSAALEAQRQRFEWNQWLAAIGGSLAFLVAVVAQLGIRKELEQSAEQAKRDAELAHKLRSQAKQLRANRLELAQRLLQQEDLGRQLNAEVKRGQYLIESLERANRELDQFAYVTSHDLKAPLRGIANLAAFIEEDLSHALNDETRENLALLHQRVNRMELMIEGILTYSRAGRHTEAEWVDLRALVLDVIDLLSPGSTVQFSLVGDFPELVTERAPLQQVFLNLIGNAIKHGEADAAKIEVRAVTAIGGCQISVKDNGPGIEERFHQRIFGFFERLSRRDDVEGSGIGLAVVKKVVEDRGGRVWVESELGQGATFHVLWPNDPETLEKTRRIQVEGFKEPD